MRYVEKELYEGIETRLLAGAIESHYTDNGHVKPVTVRQFNDDYDSDGGGQQPYNRPAVFVEFGEYELQDMGGYVKGPVPITLHVVQDNYNQSGNISPAQETKYQDKLKYPSLIQELLHQYRISNCILDVKQPQKLQEQKSLLVFTIQITARVRVPRRSSSLPAETPLSAFSYSNASQTVDEGNPIAPIIASTTGDVARFVVDINSTIISGLVLDASTGQISGTPTAQGSFKVCAVSQYGVVIGVVEVSVMFTASATPITNMVISNDGQTIYEASGNGAFTPIVFTPTPAEATFTLDDANVPAGLEISGNQIQVSNFANIPVGVNTFDVDWLGTGDYSGNGTISVTVTKREVAELDDVTGVILQGWWDVSESGTITESDNLISQVNGRHSGGENAVQLSLNNRPIKSSLNGNRCALFTGSSYLEVLLPSEVNQSFSIFISGKPYIGTGNTYWVGGTTDINNRRIWHDLNKRFNFNWGVNTTVNLTTDEVISLFDSIGVLTEFFFNGAASKVTIDGGETLDQVINTTNSLSAGFYIGSYGGGPNGFSGKMVEIAVISGVDTTTKRQLIEGVMAWKAGTQSKLNTSHPYKSTPPFKPLP